MPTAIVSLGSNLGDRAATLDGAIAALDATAGIEVVRSSTWYETNPIGGPEFQDPFLNGAAVLETTLEPEALLTELQRIENEHGREREQHWGPRTLDLDLLTYDDVVCHTPRLTLPHPRLSYRKFVLQGVVEIAPDAVHPVSGLRFSDFKMHLESTPNYVAFVGLSSGFRSQFAAEAADCARAILVEATPRDVPPFSEFIAAPSLDLTTAIRFVQARASAIDNTITDEKADGTWRWIIDDGSLYDEVAEISELLDPSERAKLAEFFNQLHHTHFLEPKVVAALRLKDEPPFAAALGKPQREAWPTIDIDISDRERALTEFAAALDAAR